VDTCWHERLVVICCGQGHLSQVKDEVANLSEELILVDVPVLAVASRNVRICIKKGNPLEAITALDRGRVEGIANELCIV
jgi:hypothetical protein